MEENTIEKERSIHYRNIGRVGMKQSKIKRRPTQSYFISFKLQYGSHLSQIESLI